MLRLPPTDVFAIVHTAEVPADPPPSMASALEPVVDGDRLLDWKLCAEGLLQAGVAAAYWSWRHEWTRTWSIGPISNLRSLRAWSLVEHAPGADLHAVLDRVCRAEARDEWIDAAGLDQLDSALIELRASLSRAPPRTTGVEMIDHTYAGRRPSRTLRMWAAASADTVLSANTDVVVLIRDQHGLVVLHGDRHSVAFTDVAYVDLSGELVHVVNRSGEELVLTPSQALPLSWLAPDSLRWVVDEIPIADVWRPFVDGLLAACVTARQTRSAIRLTVDLA